MDTTKREYIKANLSPLNKQLNKHGDSRIKLSLLNFNQAKLNFCTS